MNDAFGMNVLHALGHFENLAEVSDDELEQKKEKPYPF
jgi:hypothetical protein